MLIFSRNEKNGSPAPTQNNVAIDQALIVIGQNVVLGRGGDE